MGKRVHGLRTEQRDAALSQEALQAQPLLFPSPAPEPGGPGMEWGYQGHP